jgi:hypothetical protein
MNHKQLIRFYNRELKEIKIRMGTATINEDLQFEIIIQYQTKIEDKLYLLKRNIISKSKKY